ncbi:alpha-amylase family glycosyl hydrolase [Marivirga salinae]|uniref:Alpha-amylase family glycosyl hydrolase n=1 Tax=Marivirga salinarum TaxID=3059078 RepID=A0AA51N9K9_9BACT|nr:alpha-amylase family glycosyl hydrolase [Marivirga sp. BDSF4-3]WMN11239.1 alpha-amylase family glycosyl hydrolase [Marivirga sp. BDSF4-3]
MRKQLLFIIIIAGIVNYSCQSVQDKMQQDIILTYPEKAKDMNIYEVNIRQYTAEGTINAFIPHIDRLKNMGVDILWIMPVQPIGKKNRKEPLGSYYSIKNYTAINPNFGTLEDFNRLVDTAHEKDMIVLLDWVANHTAYDHHWAEEHPEYYNLDSVGNLQSPVEDWTDVADLNYDNQELHQAMIKEMKWWITEADIDGFRCDMAGMVPNEFWKKAIDSLEATKDVFMLAEWEEPKIHDAGFDMSYGWEFHHMLNDIAKGKANADSVVAYLEKDAEKYDSTAFRMYFTSNHDENSWAGTVFERMGDAYEALAVLTATVPGMPLIYSGQEAGLDKRLPFFDKDSIDWSNLEYEEFYSQLLMLKKNNPALWNGAFGGSFQVINSAQNSSELLAFSRKKDDNEVIIILNLSDSIQTLKVDRNYFDKSYQKANNPQLTVSFSENQEPMAFDPWSYMILTKNSLNIK